MRFLKQQNLNKFRRTDKTVYTDTIGRVEMRTPMTLLLPRGNTGERPKSPENGQIRYNTDTAEIEAYTNGQWRQIRYKESVSIVQQSLGFGDYVKQLFGPLNPIPSAGQNIIVLIENIVQIYNVNYTLQSISGEWFIYFDSPPPNKLITVLHNFDK
jgi:hypothetical protein